MQQENLYTHNLLLMLSTFRPHNKTILQRWRMPSLPDCPAVPVVSIPVGFLGDCRQGTAVFLAQVILVDCLGLGAGVGAADLLLWSGVCETLGGCVSRGGVSAERRLLAR